MCLSLSLPTGLTSFISNEYSTGFCNFCPSKPMKQEGGTISPFWQQRNSYEENCLSGNRLWESPHSMTSDRGRFLVPPPPNPKQPVIFPKQESKYQARAQTLRRTPAWPQQTGTVVWVGPAAAPGSQSSGNGKQQKRNFRAS